MEKELYGEKGSREKQLVKKDKGFFSLEKAGIKKGVIGGMIMIGIATVWFVGGLFVGLIFFYPPILFLIGVYALLKGLVTGNVNGEKQSTMTEGR
ncbi:MAG: hypothetical protein MUO82_02635 [Candidatus Thermoplasmatota archaeon]|nr:hypothetical protein [Candidatus Thermoplasmatota archaeon]